MSSPIDAVALIKRFITECQEGGNVDLIDEIIDVDYVDKTAAPGTIPTREGLKQTIQYMLSVLKDFKVEIIYCISDGKVVATTKLFRGVQVGDMFGKPATNKPIQMQVMDFVTVVDNKVTEHWNTIGPIIDL